MEQPGKGDIDRLLEDVISKYSDEVVTAAQGLGCPLDLAHTWLETVNVIWILISTKCAAQFVSATGGQITCGLFLVTVQIMNNSYVLICVEKNDEPWLQVRVDDNLDVAAACVYSILKSSQ